MSRQHPRHDPRQCQCQCQRQCQCQCQNQCQNQDQCQNQNQGQRQNQRVNGCRMQRRSGGRSQLARFGRLRGRLVSDRGSATAEYAIATLAAVGFAGLLVVILRSDAVREMLTSLIRHALSYSQ